MRTDYVRRIKSLEAHYEKPFNDLLKHMYLEEKMSAIEITEHFWSETGNKITPRSIQRHLKALNLIRSIKDAFNLADRRGRVKYVYKSVKYKRPDARIAGLRHKILTRDGFKCTLCGNTAEKTILEMDHVVPICRGGLTNEENLRTLCYLCNTGKRINENER